MFLKEVFSVRCNCAREYKTYFTRVEMYGVKNPGSLPIRGSQKDYWKGLDWARLYSGLDHVFIFISVMFSIIPVWYLHEPDLSYAETNNGGLAR